MKRASRRAVVTGGAGFIGSHVVELLVGNGYDVRVLDDLSTCDASYVDPAAELVEVDLASNGWEGALNGADVVFHVAALPRIQPSFDDPVTHERANVIATINCVIACREAGVRRLVYSSSSSCYGNPVRLPTPEDEPIDPLSPYALQKYAGERNCLLLGDRYGIETVCLRYFNVYGPRSFNERNPFNAYSPVVGIFSSQRARGEPLTITGDGSQERDFIHVTDVARANLAAAEADAAAGVYNVGSGETISILALAQLFEHPYRFIDERKGEARVTWADTARIRRELGWEPTVSLFEGIRQLEQV
jgi:UDP-glucose 4-epimerase